MKGALAMAAFALLDHLIWVVVRTLPGPRLIRLSRQRPWRRLALRLSPQRQQWCYARIRSLLSRRCRQDPLASTCLSRSLAGHLQKGRVVGAWWQLGPGEGVFRGDGDLALQLGAGGRCRGG